MVWVRGGGKEGRVGREGEGGGEKDAAILIYTFSWEFSRPIYLFWFSPRGNEGLKESWRTHRRPISIHKSPVISKLLPFIYLPFQFSYSLTHSLIH